MDGDGSPRLSVLVLGLFVGGGDGGVGLEERNAGDDGAECCPSGGTSQAVRADVACRGDFFHADVADNASTAAELVGVYFVGGRVGGGPDLVPVLAGHE